MNPTDHYKHLHVLLTEAPDPRELRGRRHDLADILFIALVAIIAGADDAEAIEEFGEQNESWLRERCGLRSGVPSQDTFLRVLALLDPESFGAVFRRWVDALWGDREAGHIAIDGKTLRRSFDRSAGIGPVHSVSAWLSSHGLVLGQVKVENKENEIVAIPKLLKLIDVTGCTITIDAMGCQRAIAETIVEGGGHYVLAVKDNHPTLHKEIAQFFVDAERSTRPLDEPKPLVDVHHEVDGGHGRVEERKCSVSNDLSWVSDASDWTALCGIAKIERTRHVVSSGKTTQETAYFILSDPAADAARVQRLVRSHWGIENCLHWVLDMAFDEDSNRVRTKNAAENFATLRRAGFNLLKTAPEPRRKKTSIQLRRKICWGNRSYLETVLRIPPLPTG